MDMKVNYQLWIETVFDPGLTGVDNYAMFLKIGHLGYDPLRTHTPAISLHSSHFSLVQTLCMWTYKQCWIIPVDTTNSHTTIRKKSNMIVSTVSWICGTEWIQMWILDMVKWKMDIFGHYMNTAHFLLQETFLSKYTQMHFWHLHINKCSLALCPLGISYLKERTKCVRLAIAKLTVKL